MEKLNLPPTLQPVMRDGFVAVGIRHCRPLPDSIIKEGENNLRIHLRNIARQAAILFCKYMMENISISPGEWLRLHDHALQGLRFSYMPV